MSEKIKFKFYSDPNHGWLAVKRKVLEDLNITKNISSFSYQRGNTVYLEEHCDLSTLILALRLKDITIEYDEHYTNNRSPIRSYDCFQA